MRQLTTSPVSMLAAAQEVRSYNTTQTFSVLTDPYIIILEFHATTVGPSSH